MASFGNELTGIPGVNASEGESSRGTGEGGDYNFTGELGDVVGWADLAQPNHTAKGGSVGVYLSELSERIVVGGSNDGLSVGLIYGNSILGFGGGAPIRHYATATNNQAINSYAKPLGLPACVIIVPLEMEE